uniref:Uncharacterized protein n=1 Tax=Arundo donax TaxID=35708 RepID=A0A0A9BHW1_ARUDO
MGSGDFSLLYMNMLVHIYSRFKLTFFV